MTQRQQDRPARAVTTRRRRALAVTGVVASMLLGGGAVIAPPVAAAAPAAPAADPGTGTRAVSPDGRLAMSVTPSRDVRALPIDGADLTFSYRVTNTTSRPAYYRGLTDTVCAAPGAEDDPATSGLQTDGVRSWIPAGGTATFTCATLVTQDATATATAVFDTTTDDRSASDPTTVTVRTPLHVADQPCATPWYVSDRTPAGGPVVTARGTIGRVDPRRGSTRPFTPVFHVADLADGQAGTSSLAFAVDASRPDSAFFVGNTGAVPRGLFHLDLRTGATEKIAPVTPATTTVRLAADGEGRLWSWATNGRLYSLDRGATDWIEHRLTGARGLDGRTVDLGVLASGDLAVDGDGDLWLLAGDQTTGRTVLLTIASPSSGGDLTAHVVGTIPSAGQGQYYAGADFGVDGHLYATTGPNAVGAGTAPGRNRLFRIDPATGTRTELGSSPTAGIGSVGDVGSCALPRSELAVTTTTDAEGAVARGDLVTYTVRVAQMGRLAAVGATLSAPLPPGATYVPNSTTLNGVAVADVRGGMPYAAPGAAAAVTEVHSPDARPGTVAPGRSALVRYTVRVVDAARLDHRPAVTDTTSVVSSDDPTRPGRQDPTRPAAARPGLAVAQTVDRDRLAGDGTLEYTTVVRNTGTEPLVGLKVETEAVSDRRGDAREFAEDTCAVPTLRRGSDADGDGALDVGEPWVYTCRQSVTRIDGDPDRWTLTRAVSASAFGAVSGTSSTADGDPVPVSVTAAPAAMDVAIESGTVAGPDSVTGRLQATYTVTVRNTGQQDGRHGPIRVVPRFAPGLRPVVAGRTRPDAQDVGQVVPLADDGSFVLSDGGTITAGRTDAYKVVVELVWTSTTPAAPCDGTPGRGLYARVVLPDGLQDATPRDDAACLAPGAPPAPRVDLTHRSGGVVDVDADGVVSVGDTVAFSSVVTNRSRTFTLSDIRVTDPLTGSAVCAATRLPVGGRTTCRSAPYVLTRADLDRGVLRSTARVEASPPHLPAVTASATTRTSLPAAPPVRVVRSSSLADADRDGFADAGERVRHRYTVENTGSRTLTGLVVDDPAVRAASARVVCDVTTLPAGGRAACRSTVAIPVTAADVRRGSVAGSATATARLGSRKGPLVRSAVADSTVLARPGTARLHVSRGVTLADTDRDGRAGAADLATHTFTVTNTGSLPLRGLVLDDPALDVVGHACSAGPLLPGGPPVTCRVTVPLGQRAVDRGTLTDTATITARHDGRTATARTVGTLDLTRTTPAVGTALTLTSLPGSIVDADRSTTVSVGDLVRYAFSVRNTGTQTLDLLAVRDAGLPNVLSAATGNCQGRTLAPGETTTCFSKLGHPITAAELAAGRYTNDAVASAVDPRGRRVTSARARATKVIPNTPRVIVDVVPSGVTDMPGTRPGDSAGDVIGYHFQIRNVGGVPVGDVRITDPGLGLADADCATGVAGPQALLEPGAVRRCSTSRRYVVTAGDVDAGQVSRTVTVTAAGPGGRVRSTATRTTTGLAPRPGVAVSLRPDGSGLRRPGDRVSYRLTVTNTGAGTLSSIRVTVPRLGVDRPCTTASAVLPAGGRLACTVRGSTIVTRADVRGGRVQTDATVVAATGHGSVRATATASVTTIAPARTVRLGVAPRPVVDVDRDGVTDAGDLLGVRFTVTNTGDVPLRGVRLTDPALGLRDSLCTARTLQPGDTTSCDRTRRLTAAHLRAARISLSTVAVAGTGRTAARAVDTLTVSLTPRPPIAVRLTAALSDADGNGHADANDRVTYTATVTNTSNRTARPATMTAIALESSLYGALDAACPLPRRGLAPGRSVTCRPMTWRVTPHDVGHGATIHDLSARAALVGIGATPATAPVRTVTGTTPAAPGIGLRTFAHLTGGGPGGSVRAGSRLAHVVVVSNTGTTAVTAPTVTMGLTSGRTWPVTCPTGRLEPSTNVTCRVEDVVLTADDVTGPTVSTVAVASAVDDRGERLVAPGQVSTIPVAR